MVLGGCDSGADGAPADQLNGGSSKGQRQQPRGRRLIGKVMELQIGVAAATMMQVQVVPKDLGKLFVR